MLAGLFWGDHCQERARRCLNTTLWRLRQVLELEGIPRGTYLLTPAADEVSFNWESDYWLDAALFEEQAGQILTKPVEAMNTADVQILRQALQLYTGDLLEGFYDDWVLREREQLRRLYLNSLAHLLHYYSSFDIDLPLIALAPELDRRYKRLYAYLQDDVRNRYPLIDLALNLLCHDAAERIERRVHFAPDAPLIRHGLLHLIPEPNEAQPSLLAHALRLDRQIVDFLLHQDGLDARLAPFCRLVFSSVFVDELPLPVEKQQGLNRLVTQVWDEQRPLALYFQGSAPNT